jgi:hypothetical protein
MFSVLLSRFSRQLTSKRKQRTHEKCKKYIEDCLAQGIDDHFTSNGITSSKQCRDLSIPAHPAMITTPTNPSSEFTGTTTPVEPTQDGLFFGAETLAAACDDFIEQSEAGDESEDEEDPLH